MISRLHATIKYVEDGSWHLFDEGGMNGIFVNGKRLAQRSYHKLEYGDEIIFGEKTSDSGEKPHR